MRTSPIGYDYVRSISSHHLYPIFPILVPSIFLSLPLPLPLSFPGHSGWVVHSDTYAGTQLTLTFPSLLLFLSLPHFLSHLCNSCSSWVPILAMRSNSPMRLISVSSVLHERKERGRETGRWRRCYERSHSMETQAYYHHAHCACVHLSTCICNILLKINCDIKM